MAEIVKAKISPLLLLLKIDFRAQQCAQNATIGAAFDGPLHQNGQVSLYLHAENLRFDKLDADLSVLAFTALSLPRLPSPRRTVEWV
jgi:hypothetical protein